MCRSFNRGRVNRSEVGERAANTHGPALSFDYRTSSSALDSRLRLRLLDRRGYLRLRLYVQCVQLSIALSLFQFSSLRTAGASKVSTYLVFGHICQLSRIYVGGQVDLLIRHGLISSVLPCIPAFGQNELDPPHRQSDLLPMKSARPCFTQHSSSFGIPSSSAHLTRIGRTYYQRAHARSGM